MLFEKKNGLLPYYTHDGKTIKTSWETQDYDANKRIKEICESMIDDEVSLRKGIKLFHQIPLTYEDCDICKETTVPFTDFLIDLTEKDEDGIMKLYWEIYDEVFADYE